MARSLPGALGAQSASGEAVLPKAGPRKTGPPAGVPQEAGPLGAVVLGTGPLEALALEGVPPVAGTLPAAAGYLVRQRRHLRHC
jgi:hypothetical protein